VGTLSLPNAKAEIGPQNRRNQDREGVSGLKALGVRELTYKTAFLACSVTATSLRVRKLQCTDRNTHNIKKTNIYLINYICTVWRY